MFRFLVKLFTRFVHGAPKVENVRDDASASIAEMAEQIKQSCPFPVVRVEEPKPKKKDVWTMKRINKSILTKCF